MFSHIDRHKAHAHFIVSNDDHRRNSVQWAYSQTNNKLTLTHKIYSFIYIYIYIISTKFDEFPRICHCVWGRRTKNSPKTPLYNLTVNIIYSMNTIFSNQNVPKECWKMWKLLNIFSINSNFSFVQTHG